MLLTLSYMVFLTAMVGLAVFSDSGGIAQVKILRVKLGDAVYFSFVFAATGFAIWLLN